MRLDICVRYPACLIACAAIQLAATALDKPLPTSSTVPGHRNCDWWRIVDDTFDRISQLCTEINALYTYPKVLITICTMYYELHPDPCQSFRN
jgi:hypothetical protein